MKRASIAIFMLLFFPAVAKTITQTSQGLVTLPDRIVFRVVTLNKIDTKNAIPGDPVKMQIIASETLNDGTVIEAGTRIEGHVASSTPYSRLTREASLSIVIDRLKWKSDWIPMHGFVVAQGRMRTEEIDLPPRGRHGELQEPMTVLKSGPVLRNVGLVEIGNPTHDSYLVSHKKNIVIRPQMALLIRHAAMK